MGLWSRLCGKTVKIGDAFFGEMTIMDISDEPAKSYFEYERYFKLLVVYLSLGRSVAQRNGRKNSLRRGEADYHLLVIQLIPASEARFGIWVPQLTIKDFNAEFKPTLLAIPTCDQRPIEWEIVFDTVPYRHGQNAE